MTLSSNNSSATLDGNGATTSFPFDFVVWSTSQLRVYITGTDGLTDITTNWTATLTETGGNVVYPAVGGTVLPTGASITILRDMPLTQTIKLTSGVAFDPTVIETALDQITGSLQQINEEAERSVKVAPGSSVDPADLLNTLTADAVSAAASAATAATQAGLAATARTGAETAQGLAEDARDAAVAAVGAVKVSADDTTAGYLDGKLALASNSGLVTAVLSPGGNETLTLAVDLDTDPGLTLGAGGLKVTADMLRYNASKVRTKSHPCTKSAVTDNSLTPDLTTAETFDWTPTGAATLNAPTIIGSGVWAIRYNYTSGPTLPKATYDGSVWAATGDILLVVGFGSADYELVWLNKA